MGTVCSLFLMKTNRQTTDHVLMVRPAAFGYNPETAASNAFQQDIAAISQRTAIATQAVAEFDQFVAQLRSIGIEVTVVTDSPTPPKPDAVFPNNWFSTHYPASAVFYPMESPIRRQEVRPDVLDLISLSQPVQTWDLAVESSDSARYLEGTGSMVLDRINRVAYACASSRTDEQLFLQWCRRMEYLPIYFEGNDSNGSAIYHTNVMMSLGERFCVLCTAAIQDKASLTNVSDQLRQTGHHIIPISFAQMAAFAGNVLQLKNKAGKSYIIMSDRAYKAFDDPQRSLLGQFGDLVVIPLDVIELYGGGSVRCMMAEVFF